MSVCVVWCGGRVYTEALGSGAAAAAAARAAEAASRAADAASLAAEAASRAAAVVVVSHMMTGAHGTAARAQGEARGMARAR